MEGMKPIGLRIDIGKVIAKLVEQEMLEPIAMAWSQRERYDFEDGYENGRWGEDFPADESPAFIAGWRTAIKLRGKKLSEEFPESIKR